MATVFDVAKHILKKQGEMTAMKLQKLVYYSKAWHAVWEEEELFHERIEAWINGPVCPDLYTKHKGKFKVNPDDFEDCCSLSTIEKESIDNVLQYYGDKSSQWLSDLTHAEEPWKDTRKNLSPNDRSNKEITVSAMMEYYGSL